MANCATFVLPRISSLIYVERSRLSRQRGFLQSFSQYKRFIKIQILSIRVRLENFDYTRQFTDIFAYIFEPTPSYIRAKRGKFLKIYLTIWKWPQIQCFSAVFTFVQTAALHDQAKNDVIGHKKHIGSYSANISMPSERFCWIQEKILPQTIGFSTSFLLLSPSKRHK